MGHSSILFALICLHQAIRAPPSALAGGSGRVKGKQAGGLGQGLGKLPRRTGSGTRQADWVGYKASRAGGPGQIRGLGWPVTETTWPVANSSRLIIKTYWPKYMMYKESVIFQK